MNWFICEKYSPCLCEWTFPLPTWPWQLLHPSHTIRRRAQLVPVALTRLRAQAPLSAIWNLGVVSSLVHTITWYFSCSLLISLQSHLLIIVLWWNTVPLPSVWLLLLCVVVAHIFINWHRFTQAGIQLPKHMFSAFEAQCGVSRSLMPVWNRTVGDQCSPEPHRAYTVSRDLCSGGWILPSQAAVFVKGLPGVKHIIWITCHCPIFYTQAE